MYEDIRSGRRADFNARDYWHNRAIDRLFQRARRVAWASIKNDSDILKLIEEQRRKNVAQLQKRNTTANILNIYK